MKRNEKISISDKVFWAIFAFVAFSSWSSYILTNVAGLRSNVYELYFIPLILYYHKNVIRTLKTRGLKITLPRGMMTYLGYVVFCFIIGFFVCAGREIFGSNSNLVKEHILAFRFVLYSALIICYFSRASAINLDLLLYISFFSVLGDFIAILTIHSSSYAITLNLIALSLLVIIPIVQNRLIVSVACVLFSLVVAFRSSYRISIAIVILTVFFALIYSAAIRKKMKSVLLLLAAVIGFVILIENFDYYVKAFADTFGMQYASYRRISYRITEAIHGGEIGRSGIYLERIQLCFSEVLPFGLFRRAVGEYGWYTDTPFVFILDAFGLIGGGKIIFSTIKKGIQICKLAFKRHDLHYLGVLAIMLPVYIVLFVINGTFLFWTYVTCLSGVILGYWFNPGIENLNL